MQQGTSNYAQAGFVRSTARAPGVVQTVGTAAAALVSAPSPARPTISRVNIDLGTARTLSNPLEIETAGTHVWCAWATDTSCLVQIQIGDQEYIPFMMNHAVEGVRFDRLRVINAQQTGKVLTLVIISDPSLRANVE
jgi:hypothetical protein